MHMIYPASYYIILTNVSLTLIDETQILFIYILSDLKIICSQPLGYYNNHIYKVYIIEAN